MWIEGFLLTMTLGANPVIMAEGQQSISAIVVADPLITGRPIAFPIPIRESSDPTVDAFSKIPQAQGIGESSDATGSETPQNDGKFTYAVFQHPASFELTTPPSSDGRSATDTAVIYEGMALRFKKCDGGYTLRMVLETPPTNVTLRLQLGVIRQCSVLQPTGQITCSPVRVGTITLPPIRIEGASQTASVGQPRLWSIQCEGHSPLLKSNVAPTECDQGLSFVRIGTAEFGVVPQR